MLNFAVYSRENFAQVLSFREIVQADDAAAAGSTFLKRRHGRRRDIVLGVKAFDLAIRRCSEGGRWLA